MLSYIQKYTATLFSINSIVILMTIQLFKYKNQGSFGNLLISSFECVFKIGVFEISEKRYNYIFTVQLFLFRTPPQYPQNHAGFFATLGLKKGRYLGVSQNSSADELKTTALGFQLSKAKSRVINTMNPDAQILGIRGGGNFPQF